MCYFKKKHCRVTRIVATLVALQHEEKNNIKISPGINVPLGALFSFTNRLKQQLKLTTARP